MHRFFWFGAPLLVGQLATLTPLLNQLHNVLRLQAGERIVLLDNSGEEIVTEITRIGRHGASGRVLERRPCPGEPALQLTLYQCSLKADKFEWVLQKGAELGVSRFVPVISNRCVVRPAEALLPKYERWRAILREAAEQCGRARLPELALPLAWPAALQNAVGAKWLAWEERSHRQSGVLLSERSYSTASLHNLLIGPEGGLDEQEVSLAEQNGWRVISLGPRILRAETAALAGVTLMMALAEEHRHEHIP
jgi:16S rRNA (uracil1498-N3)-methyltransferase